MWVGCVKCMGFVGFFRGSTGVVLRACGVYGGLSSYLESGLQVCGNRWKPEA